MKKALVFYLYSNNNAGDMAICMGAIDLLKAAGFNVTFVSRFAESDHEYSESVSYVHSYHPDVRIEPGVLAINRDGGFVSKLLSYAYGAWKTASPAKDKRFEWLIREADVVFFNGGNLLRCASFIDASRLHALFYPVRMAQRMGKRVICLPQSTAESSSSGKRLLRKKLSSFSDVFIRESESLRRMQADYPDVVFRRSIDLAFFIQKRGELSEDFKRLLRGRIAITVRGTGIGDIGRLSNDRISDMLDGLRHFMLNRPDSSFVIVVQTKKDRELSENLLASLDETVEVLLVEEHDPLKLISIYSLCASLVTMRLHAGILAIRAGIPVVGLFDEAWGLKNKGFTIDFGMGYTTDPDCLESEYDLQIAHFDFEVSKAIVSEYERQLLDELPRQAIVPEERDSA